MKRVSMKPLMIAVAIAVLANITAYTAPVNAANACCGRVKNLSQSDKWLAVGRGYPYVNYKERLYPGMSSTSFYRDADAVYIPSGCRGAFTAPGRALAWKTGGRWYEVHPLPWPYHNYSWSVEVVC